MHTRTLPCFLALLALTTLAPATHGQCGLDELFPADGQADDRFGAAVALSGDTLIVGDVGRQYPEPQPGRAHLYQHIAGAWTALALLSPSTSHDGDFFGAAVAIEGERLAVGAPAHESRGKVFLFERSGADWLETAVLEAPAPALADNFGGELALDGERLAVSAIGRDEHGANSGAVYVYERVAGAWELEQELFASDADGGDLFGESLDLAGDTLVAGAPSNSDLGQRTGSAYVFERTTAGWVETAKLTAGAPVTYSNFGLAVAVEGNHLLIGRRTDDEPIGTAGVVFWYEQTIDGWVERAKLHAGDPSPQAGFGSVLAMDAGRALVGAPRDSNAGAVYLLERQGAAWVELDKLGSPAPITDARFGEALDLEGGRVLVGAPRDQGAGTLTGSAFVGAPYGGVANTCIGAPNSNGPGAAMGSTGSPSITLNGFHLAVNGAASQQPGLFFYGAGEVQVPFGDGFRCVAPPLFRLLPPLFTDTSGSTDRHLDVTDPPEIAATITAGSTWYFQFWYRDPAAGGSGFNLSDALEVGFCD